MQQLANVVNIFEVTCRPILNCRWQGSSRYMYEPGFYTSNASSAMTSFHFLPDGLTQLMWLTTVWWIITTQLLTLLKNVLRCSSFLCLLCLWQQMGKINKWVLKERLGTSSLNYVFLKSYLHDPTSKFQELEIS